MGRGPGRWKWTIWSSFIFQEELIYNQYNMIQLLNNLFQVGGRWKNTDDIYYTLTSLVSLKQGDVKNSTNLMKLVNLKEKNLHFFRMISGISMKFLRKKNTFLEKAQGHSNWPPAYLWLNIFEFSSPWEIIESWLVNPNKFSWQVFSHISWPRQLSKISATFFFVLFQTFTKK